MINPLLFWRQHSMINPGAARLPVTGQPDNLSQVKVGKSVKITGFGPLTAAQRQHLQAYGLLPGRSVVVLSQKPVTIVLVEQTELAFESEIARQVKVSIEP